MDEDLIETCEQTKEKLEHIENKLAHKLGLTIHPRAQLIELSKANKLEEDEDVANWHELLGTFLLDYPWLILAPDISNKSATRYFYGFSKVNGHKVADWGDDINSAYRFATINDATEAWKFWGPAVEEQGFGIIFVPKVV